MPLQLCLGLGSASGFTGSLFSKYTWTVPRISQTGAVSGALGGVSWPLFMGVHEQIKDENCN